MNPGDEFDVKLKKAMDHYEGSMELGMDRRFALQKLVELGDDDKLMGDLWQDAMEKILAKKEERLED